MLSMTLSYRSTAGVPMDLLASSDGGLVHVSMSDEVVDLVMH